MTNTPNLIIQLEPSATKKTIVEYKMNTDVYLLSGGTGAIATTEKLISGEKEYEITCNVSSKKGSDSKSR